MEDCKKAKELANTPTVQYCGIFMGHGEPYDNQAIFKKCGIDTPAAVQELGEKEQHNTEKETLLDGITRKRQRLS